MCLSVQWLQYHQVVGFLNSIVILWEHHCLCGSLLTKTCYTVHNSIHNIMQSSPLYYNSRTFLYPPKETEYPLKSHIPIFPPSSPIWLLTYLLSLWTDYSGLLCGLWGVTLFTNIMFTRFTHAVVCISTSFLFRAR